MSRKVCRIQFGISRPLCLFPRGLRRKYLINISERGAVAFTYCMGHSAAVSLSSLTMYVVRGIQTERCLSREQEQVGQPQSASWVAEVERLMGSSSRCILLLLRIQYRFRSRTARPLTCRNVVQPRTLLA
jgi:hypothetical protein